MKLQTNIPLQKASSNIHYSSNIMLLGSCFAEHIATKLNYYKFQNVSNPFGILFNPRAIQNLIERSLDKRFYAEEEIFELNERWHCYDAHSDLSNGDPQSTVSGLNEAIELTNSFFAKATKDKQIPTSPRLRRTSSKSTHIIITLGTAWVYRHKGTAKLVANCHKVPQKEFDKELLSVEDIGKSIRRIIELIQSSGSEANIICTVSPVRHLKDGFTENLRSKSHLITAVQETVEDGLCEYFPSYELMMDELRDYRYYDRDMVHPNEIAIDYIWEKFKSVWINPEVYPTMSEVDQIQKGLQHRPFNAESDQHKQFVNGLKERIHDLQKKYPFMNFDMTV